MIRLLNFTHLFNIYKDLKLFSSIFFNDFLRRLEFKFNNTIKKENWMLERNEIILLYFKDTKQSYKKNTNEQIENKFLEHK